MHLKNFEAPPTRPLATAPDSGFVPVVYMNGRWRADLVKEYKLVQQLRKEAGLSTATYPDPPDAYDRLLSAASKHGLGLETNKD